MTTSDSHVVIDMPSISENENIVQELRDELDRMGAYIIFQKKQIQKILKDNTHINAHLDSACMEVTRLRKELVFVQNKMQKQVNESNRILKRRFVRTYGFNKN